MIDMTTVNIIFYKVGEVIKELQGRGVINEMSYFKNMKIKVSFQVNTELIYQLKLTMFMFLNTCSWSYWA